MTDRSDIRDRILAAIPIESYIGRYVKLKKSGRGFSGPCPFHSEKTPSFHVSPDKGLYHCFGCGKGGNLFTFVMDTEGMTFPEALQSLARYAGIEIGDAGGRPSRHKKLYDINEKAAKEFEFFLSSPDGGEFREYAKSRKISSDAVSAFRIGASPDRWQFLTEKMASDSREILELGLIRSGREKPYDFFRGRLMFPIRDPSGNVLAFGGRSLPGKDKEAKYLNSADSIVFRKGSVLYGLYEGVQGIRSEQEVILVEGYLDVIGLHQAGLKNAVAPLGTALTAAHLKLLQRYTSSYVALFDGDRAGRSAALKFTRLIVDHDEVRGSVVLLPTGMDPFDLSHALPGERIREVLGLRIPSEQVLLLESLFPDICQDAIVRETTRDPLDFARKMRAFYMEGTALVDLPLERKRNARYRLFELLDSFARESDRELFLEAGGRTLRIEKGALEREYRGHAGSKTPKSGPDIRGQAAAPMGRPGERKPEAHVIRKGPDPLVRAERELVMDFFLSPASVGALRGAMADLEFADPHAEVLWRYLENRYISGDIWTQDSLLQFELPPETLSVFSGTLIERSELDHPEESAAAEVIHERIVDHQIRVMERRIAELAADAPLPEEQEGHMRRYAEMVKELNNLKISWKKGFAAR